MVDSLSQIFQHDLEPFCMDVVELCRHFVATRKARSLRDLELCLPPALEARTTLATIQSCLAVPGPPPCRCNS